MSYWPCWVGKSIPGALAASLSPLPCTASCQPLQPPPPGWGHHLASSGCDSPSGCAAGAPCMVLLLGCPFQGLSLGPLMCLLEQTEMHQPCEKPGVPNRWWKITFPVGIPNIACINQPLPRPHSEPRDSQPQQNGTWESEYLTIQVILLCSQMFWNHFSLSSWLGVYWVLQLPSSQVGVCISYSNFVSASIFCYASSAICS